MIIAKAPFFDGRFYRVFQPLEFWDGSKAVAEGDLAFSFGKYPKVLDSCLGVFGLPGPLRSFSGETMVHVKPKIHPKALL